MLTTSFLIGSQSPSRRQSDDDLDEHLKQVMDERFPSDPSKKKKKSPWELLLSNIYFVSSLSYALWIFCGVFFYKFYSNWTWATAYYYVMDAGLSIGFCYPAEKDDWSKLFTIFYVLVGSSVISGCLGVLASSLLMNKASFVAIQHKFGSILYHEDNGDVTLTSVSRCVWYHMKYFVGWYHNRPRTITVAAFIVWMGLGTIYGIYVEHWSFITSLYWAITTSSTGGLQTAPCESGSDTTCDMGNMRGTVMGVFMMVGVPLYAATISHFARITVGKAMKARQEELISRPIEDAEFIFAANVLSPEGSTTLVLGEYILLELMRLGATNQKQIDILKRKFYELDKEKRGELDIEDLQMAGKVVPRKLSSVEMAKRIRSKSLELFGFNNSPMPNKGLNSVAEDETFKTEDLESNTEDGQAKAKFKSDARRRGSKKAFTKGNSVRFQNDENFLANAIAGDSNRNSPVPNADVPRGYSFTDFDFNIEEDELDEDGSPNSLDKPVQIPTEESPPTNKGEYDWDNGSYHSHSSGGEAEVQQKESPPAIPATSYLSGTGLFVDI